MRSLLLSCILLCAVHASAQFTIYNTGNSGLSDNYITGLAYNDSGIWVGTLDGLNLYDGTNWTNWYTNNSDLPHNIVTDLAVDSAGFIWSWNFNVGCSQFDWSTFHSFGVGQGLGNNSGSNVMWVDGELWASTYGGLSINNGGVWTNYSTADGLPHNDVRHCTVDGQGNWWVPTFGGGVGFFDGSWTTYDAGNSDLPYDEVFVVRVRDDGHVWIGTRNGLVDFFNGIMTIYNVNNSPLTDDDIRDFQFAPTGEVIIATRFGGLYILGPFGNMTNYNTSNSNIPSDELFEVILDAEDSIWVATTNGLASLSNWSIPTSIGETPAFANAKVFLANDVLNASIPEGSAQVLVYDQMGREVWNSGTQVQNLQQHLGELAFGFHNIVLRSAHSQRSWKVLIGN